MTQNELLSPEEVQDLEEVELLFKIFFIRWCDRCFHNTCCYHLVSLKIDENHNKYFIMLNLQRHFHGKWLYLSIFHCKQFKVQSDYLIGCVSFSWCLHSNFFALKYICSFSLINCSRAAVWNILRVCLCQEAVFTKSWFILPPLMYFCRSFFCVCFMLLIRKLLVCIQCAVEQWR